MRKAQSKIILSLILAILVVAVILIVVLLNYTQLVQKEIEIRTPSVDISKNFNSEQELIEYIKETEEKIEVQEKSDYSVHSNEEASGGSTNAPTVSSTGQKADDYSTTNIQEQGVDEPDFVKNDDKYIYIAKEKKVTIIDAFPAENMRIVSEIEIENKVNHIFVNKDKLILIQQGTKKSEYIKEQTVQSEKSSEHLEPNYYTRFHYNPVIIVETYNISDRSSPIKENYYEIEGAYIDSRMIGDYIYTITNNIVDLNDPEILPVYKVNDFIKSINPTDIHYFEEPDSSYKFSTISAINIDSGKINNRVYMVGQSTSVYVSKDNIFLYGSKYSPRSEYLDGLFDNVYNQILPSIERNKIQEILFGSESTYRKEIQINNLVREYSSELKGEEKAEFDELLFDKLQEFENNYEKKTLQTIINKIEIIEDNIAFVGSGKVIGKTLNQFAFSEHDRYLRVATTTGNVFADTSLNHLFILDKDMNQVGSIEDIAPGERIYSSRFIGDRAYMVTFKKVDPFYVLDLSNPTNPRILGYLKIPGFSDYMHPLDEDHIIGMGKETIEATEEEKASRGIDFAWFQGLKISVFDVSNVQDPIESAKLVIGDRGTRSLAQKEHKAFLFDPIRALLVIPVELYELDEDKYPNKKSNAYGERTYLGAYVLNINKRDISVRGRITHIENNTNTLSYYNTFNRQIERSLFMDDFLYTISRSKVKANDINSLFDISSVDVITKSESQILYKE